MAPNGHWDRHRSTSLSRGKADISDAHAWKFKHLCEFRILWSAGGFTAEHMSAFGGEADILWFAHPCPLMTLS